MIYINFACSGDFFKVDFTFKYMVIQIDFVTMHFLKGNRYTNIHNC